jgi:2-polyprenyl-6-methoxyphenol hydroxylase-like FAD-dependent oxidoreductase
LHQLLSSGLRIVEGLMPGVTARLAAAGAPAFDGDDPSLAYLEISGHPLCRTGTLRDPDAMVLRMASRPLLESVVRECVRSRPNVTVVDGHDAGEPVLRGRAVTGVPVTDRKTGQSRVLAADLVVDATGRAARTPAFLAAHGFDRPVEQSYRVGLTYSSQLFRMPAGTLHEHVAIVSPTLDRPVGAGVFAHEGQGVLLTLIGVAGHRAPTDLPDILAAATDLLPAHISTALKNAEPVGSPHQRHYPTSVWRRYDKLSSSPSGLLVIGDALCSFNPVYGQGMTSAARQARALQKVLAVGDPAELTRSYFRAAARKIGPLWQANRLNDFAVTPTSGRASWAQRAFNRYTDAYMAAAATDMALTETFLRVLQGVDPVARMMHPRHLARVAAGARRGGH